MRVRVELTGGGDERIAEIDVSRTLYDVLGDYASPQSERLMMEFVDREVMSAVRALVRGRIALDQSRPSEEADIARRLAPEDFPDGVDEALASLQACLDARLHAS